MLIASPGEKSEESKVSSTASGIEPVLARQRLTNSVLETVRSSEGISSMASSPRWAPELAAANWPPFEARVSETGRWPTEARWWRTMLCPSVISCSSSSSFWVSTAVRSMCSTAAAVTSTGVPCGIVSEAVTKSASTSGKKVNLTLPLATSPKVIISVTRPQAIVA